MKKIEFVCPLPYAIGNQAEEIKYALIRSNLEDVNIFFLFPLYFVSKFLHYKPASIALNKLMFKLNKESEGKKTTIILLLVFNFYFISHRLIFLLVRRGLKYLQIDDKNFSAYWSFPRFGIQKLWFLARDNSKRSYGDISKDKLFDKFDKLTNLINQSEATDLLLDFHRQEIDMNLPIIVMHTRSNKFYNDGNRRNRNMTIDQYIESINIIANSGHQIVLIGDPHSVKLPPNLIDLTKEDIPKTSKEILAYYFISKCLLYIGTQSGPLDLADLLGKKCLVLNSIDIGDPTPSLVNALYVLKPIKKQINYSYWLRSMPYNLYDNEEFYGSLNESEIPGAMLANIVKMCVKILTSNSTDSHWIRLMREYFKDNSMSSSDYIINMVSDKDMSLIKTKMLTTLSDLEDKKTRKTYYGEMRDRYIHRHAIQVISGVSNFWLVPEYLN